VEDVVGGDRPRLDRRIGVHNDASARRLAAFHRAHAALWRRHPVSS